MFISNSHGFIFIHLHKCAGTSVEIALSATQAWNDVLLGSTAVGEYIQRGYQRQFGLYKHSCAARVHEVVGNEFWTRCFSFATVRNPFAVAVSQYTFSISQMQIALRKLKPAPGGSAQTPSGGFAQAPSGGFAQAPSEGPEQRAQGVGNARPQQPGRWPWEYPGVKALVSLGSERPTFSEFIRSPHLENWTGFGPMRPQLCDARGTLLVNEVIKLEDLAQRWPALCARLGVGELPLGRDNPSVRGKRDFREYYANGRDVDHVRAVFAGDFEFFGYDDHLK